MKIKFLFSGNFDIEGKARHFEEGEIIDASPADGELLVTGLCAELVSEKKTKTAKAEKWQPEEQ